MYSFLLIAHSIIRWLVVLLAVLAVGKALAGWFGKQAWTRLDDRLGMFYTMALDIQLLIGILLYFFSPLTRSALAGFGAAMADPILRFFLLVHWLVMLAVVALAHVGRVRARKAAGAVEKHRRTAIFFGLSILLAMFAIPWPFTQYARPWLRL